MLYAMKHKVKYYIIFVLLSLVTLVSLIYLVGLTSASLSYGETVSVTSENRSAADILFDYGIIEGYKGDLMVGSVLTRAEACVLLAELNHQKVDAQNTGFRAYFSDVKNSEWYAPYVTYARTMGWISGYPDGTFHPDAAISGQEWASMMLKLMNYPYTWETVSDEIMKLGINFKENQFADFYRGEAFELLWQVLNTRAFGEDVVMGMKLNYFKEASLESPSLIGYFTPSLRMVKVKFDMPLDESSAENVDHYDVNSLFGTHVEIEAVEYDAVTDEVAIIFNQPLSTYEVIEIQVENILSAEGTSLEPVTIRGVEMIDIVNPSVLSAGIMDENHVIIIFSEPVLDFDAQSIGLISTSAQVISIEMMKGNTQAYVTLDQNISDVSTVRVYSTILDDYGHKLITQNVTLVTF